MSNNVINLDQLFQQNNHTHTNTDPTNTDTSNTDPTNTDTTNIEHNDTLTIDELMECNYLTLNDVSKSQIITYFSELISTTRESMRNFRDIFISETVRHDIQNNNQIFTNNIFVDGSGYSIIWYLFKNNNKLYFIHKNQINGNIGWKEANFNIL